MVSSPSWAHHRFRFVDVKNHTRWLQPYQAQDVFAHVQWALIYIAQGKSREAITAAQNARQDEPPADWPTAVRGMAYAAGGQRVEAEKVLSEMNRKASRGWVSSYAFAEIYAGLRDKAQTLDALENPFEERSWFLAYLNTAPEFDFIRSEPRFQALLCRMNFPHRFHVPGPSRLQALDACNRWFSRQWTDGRLLFHSPDRGRRERQ